MLKLLTFFLFCWLFSSVLRLSFRITWGLAKAVAVVLFVVALPAMIGCLLFVSGMLLFLPVVLVAVSWGILRLVA